MRKVFTLLCPLLFYCSFLTAQFDTIAGPFPIVFDMTASEDFVFAAVGDFDGDEIRAYDGLELNDPGRIVYTNTTPLSSPFTSIYYDNDALYVSSSGPSIQTGSIRKVTNLKATTPDVELILDLPWLPTQVVAKDNMLYISRLYFVGGGIYTYDMNDPNPELELLLQTGSDILSDLIIEDNHLLASISSEKEVVSIDLNRSRPRLDRIISNLDGPSGLTIDQDQLYVVTNNFDRNASARVGVYTYDQDKKPSLITEEASNTEFIMRGVERLDNQTYVIESVEGTGADNDLGYLLRVPSILSSQSQITKTPVVKIYPNPSSSYVEFDGLIPRQVDILGINGKLFKSEMNNTSQVNVSDLPSGVYIMILYLDDGTYQRSRLIKQ